MSGFLAALHVDDLLHELYDELSSDVLDRGGGEDRVDQHIATGPLA